MCALYAHRFSCPSGFAGAYCQSAPNTPSTAELALMFSLIGLLAVGAIALIVAAIVLFYYKTSASSADDDDDGDYEDTSNKQFAMRLVR